MLTWPDEGIFSQGTLETWSQPESNLVLDFHGDPLNADLVVFSDGNHHMALEPSLQAFKELHPQVGEIFYATTPPGPILNLLQNGRLRIGNFILSVAPHVFLSPPHVLDKLVSQGHMADHRPFVRNRGSVLLVGKGNPKKILGAGDLAREDVRLFLSNPVTETVSYRGYVDTLKALGTRAGSDMAFLETRVSTAKIYFGQSVHHREAPESVVSGIVDAAMVYYHLALRYMRIFPEDFDLIPLGGTVNVPDPEPGNVVGFTHAGLIGDGGPWGRRCLDFLFSSPVADIYAQHGLDAMFSA
ncbi:hypothetical protein Dvar_62010 [Desulfosarcina variabilis str. Montpellier]|uniref:substrate-binding domain-containing protein n=1 Tax=Desulfosarcina variabilis TaxID=2300 RepID=UPI003AFA1B61